MLFGSVPLLVYLGFYTVKFENENMTFIIASCATAVTLFVLGCAKAKRVRRSSISAPRIKPPSAASQPRADIARANGQCGLLTHAQRHFALRRFTKQSLLMSGAWMTLNGTLAASAAYLIGFVLEKVLDVGEGC